MARYTGPSYKQARRVGFSISETGKELARRPYGPGQHGNARKGNIRKDFLAAMHILLCQRKQSYLLLSL